MAIELTDKVAVITGGASGIGLATCEALLQHGLRAMAVVDRASTVHGVCHGLNDRVGRSVAIGFEGDVTSVEFRRSVFAQVSQKHGPVHFCVPAAGITRDRLAVRIERDSGQVSIYNEVDFRTLIDVNLIAPVYWAMETVGTIAEDRRRRGLDRWHPEETVQGVIVLIGSVSSAGNKGQIAYATAKAGLAGAQATLAMEAIHYGVRCAVIHPGYTDTPMVQALGQERIVEHILPHTQLRRLLQPEEVADGIVFLLRNPAVGGALWIDAGWHPAA